MVNVIQHENTPTYQCEECGLRYAERALAEQCERWCHEHQSCNLEITARAIENEA